MHTVSRSLLLAGVLAFGTLTAACGDKVELVTNTSNIGISSITLTPPSATITAGSTIQLAVVVVADASTAKTVTYTSSATSVATVDATGKVTGVAAGTATIIATSTADPTKAAASVITVTGTVVQAGNTVAISTVNQGNAPANLGNVAGQLDVTLFVTGPAAQLDLIMNCGAGDVVVASQVTNGTQQNQSNITLSFNTAATGTIVSGTAVPNATSTTPIFLNGNCVLKAKYGTATAQNITPITLNNASFYRTTIATTGNSAISAVNGFNYLSGDLIATITPVNYVTANGLSQISGTFAGRTFTNVTPATGTQTFTVTFPGGVVAQGTTVPALSISQYTSPTAGDNLQITSSVTTAGGNGFVGVFPTAGPIRIDNSAPNAATGTVANPSGAQIVPVTNFVNGPYAFSSGLLSVTDSLQTSNSGTNTVVTTVGYAASTVAALAGNTNYPNVPAGQGVGATQCSYTGFTIVTTGSQIPQSPAGAPTQYRARSFSADKIGNIRCQDLVGAPGAANANGFFGVDLQAPTLTQTAGPATNTRVFTGNTDSFAFQDSVSGFVLNRQVQYSLYRNFSAVTANCVPIVDGVNATQTGSTANGCTGTANSAPNVVIDGNTAVEAYYNLTAKAVDQAGNFSAPLNYIYLLDNTAPVVQGISIPQNLTGGVPQTFTSTATDNVDLKASTFDIQYSLVSAASSNTGQGLDLYYAGDNYGPNYDATIIKSAAVNATVPFFIKQIQGEDGASQPLPLTAADSGEAQLINVRAIDAANLISVASNAGIPNINISSSAGFTVGVEFNTFQETNAAQTLSNGTGTGTRSTTLSAAAVLNSATAQSANVPFSQVCFFYQQTAAGFAADPTIPQGSFVQVGCVTAPSITDVAGLSRTWTYQLTGFDPPAALGTAGTVPLIAIGIKSSGVGVASLQNNNITLAP